MLLDWQQCVSCNGRFYACREGVRDHVTQVESDPIELESRRALVLHDSQIVVDLIELTLNHGLFVVKAAHSLDEAAAILTECPPHLTVIDMDHDDSTAVLERLGASNTLTRSASPVLGLTRRGDLKTKLNAFDLGSTTS